MRVDKDNVPLNGGNILYIHVLAASLLTLILSIFSIYFMMCMGNSTAKVEGKQEVSTDMELRPRCLGRQ